MEVVEKPVIIEEDDTLQLIICFVKNEGTCNTECK